MMKMLASPDSQSFLLIELRFSVLHPSIPTTTEGQDFSTWLERPAARYGFASLEAFS